VTADGVRRARALKGLATERSGALGPHERGS